MSTINKKTIEDFLKSGVAGGNFAQRHVGICMGEGDADVIIQADNEDDKWFDDTRFVHYMRKKVHSVEAGAGITVISGPFTGCKMASYIENGKRYVCHIAFDAGSDNKNEVFFNGFKSKEGREICAVFSPFEEMSDGKYDMKNLFNSEVYGIIGDDNMCYSFVVASTVAIKNDLKAEYKIVGWKQYKAEKTTTSKEFCCIL